MPLEDPDRFRGLICCQTWSEAPPERSAGFLPLTTSLHSVPAFRHRNRFQHLLAASASLPRWRTELCHAQGGERAGQVSLSSAATPLRTRPHLELTGALLLQLPRVTYLPVLGPLLADRAGNTPRARSMGLRGHLRRHDGVRALWRLSAESPSASSFCSLEIYRKTLSIRREQASD